MAIIRAPVFVAALAVAFVFSNELLFGLKAGGGGITPEQQAWIQPYDEVLSRYLDKHKHQIGDDFVPYRNHCLRVMAFARYFLAQDGIKEVDARTHNIMAMALAYHDIALWTDGKLDYLAPSVAQLEKRIGEEMNLSQQAEGDEGTGFVPRHLHWSMYEQDSQVAKTIIIQHHKFTAYTVPTIAASNENNNNNKSEPIEHMEQIINAIRKGDWADATMGLIRNGMPQSYLIAVYEAIPEAGFHNILANFGSRLSPHSLTGQLEVLNILKW
jgi:hypothetical protein